AISPGPGNNEPTVVVVHHEPTGEPDMAAATTPLTEIDEQTAPLSARAASLRARAETVDQITALAFRRRASELELEAWAMKIRAGADLVQAA
ncbi:MAG: hypothetical protein AAGK32_16355, partial [Actinomycetota bacterium]